MIRRIMDNNGKTLIGWVWNDGTPTCNCNDDDDPPCGNNACVKAAAVVAAIGTFVWICSQSLTHALP